MTKEELKRKQYDTWNKYYQKHKSEINARRKKVREGYKNKLSVAEKRIEDLEKENAELRKIAEFQQSSNMNTHLENKKLKEGLAVGSTWNKHLNSLNKELEEERDKYRNMVFDKDEQLTKARVLLKQFLEARNGEDTYKAEFEAEQFLSEVEK